MQRGLRHADLLAVGGWLALVDVVVLVPALRESLLRPALVVPFLLVGPGYAVVSALFPERVGTDGGPQLSGLGRLVLGFGASVGVVLAVGFLLDFSVFGFATIPVLGGVTVVTLGALVLAVVRRRRVESPAGVSFDAARERGRRAVGEQPVDIVLSVAVCLSLALAVAAVSGLPAADRSPSEAYLLTPGSDGPAAEEYPGRLTRGEPAALVLGAESGTDSATPVIAVVTLQRVAVADGTVTVREETELQRLTFTDPADGTARVEHTVTPTLSGDLRLTYAVYFDREPTGAPDRQVHLQVTVAEP
ncbi:DUF1616 domain-containing protein [Halomicroarcula sp. GCM10025709]|uniref:DUF1616 domain-containing protein n=1 Tax=Haloarcula TaxID=2237 RepID=UPI0024C44295|nr:DUF1616 domain-containing protein [Halomicroarcula sp. YJ-61-S]